MKKGTAKQLEKIIAKQKLADTKNSTYEYCTRIKKSVINKSYSKKIAQNENQKTNKQQQQQQKHPFWLPQVSGRNLRQPFINALAEMLFFLKKDQNTKTSV